MGAEQGRVAAAVAVSASEEGKQINRERPAQFETLINNQKKGKRSLVY